MAPGMRSVDHSDPTSTSSAARSSTPSNAARSLPGKSRSAGSPTAPTYALSLGLDNGSLFTHVIAFSPGFTANRRPQGRPRIFISHGKSDNVLPIDACSRRIVPQLEDAGYAVTYKEFDGPHTVPEPIAQDAFKWFVR